MEPNTLGIDQDTINEIRRSVNIVEIISEYIPLSKKGKNYFGVCPFHSDHSPSMSVSEERQIYKCFSCGAGGNVFRFLMDYENISFIDSLKMIADKTAIPLKISKFKPKTNQTNEKLYQIFEVSQMFYQNNINTKEGSEAKKYLKERNIGQEIINEFKIGLSLSNNTLLSKLLEKKGYQESEILNTGLCNKNDLKITDVYYKRIMFPLWDLSGRIVGYSGRIYNSEDNSKYINTKETKIFKKGELLYNYHRAKEEARIKNQIIIVEGFMDVIRCYSIGIKNVVATMGTAITKSQALLMKRLGKDIILCFDGDEAGEKATVSAIEELNKIDVIPKIVRLEEKLDPDEYIQKYKKEQFKLKLENPINVLDFKLSYLKKGKNLKDNIETSNYINQMLLEIGKIDDDILRELTLNKLSLEYKIDIDILRSKIKPIEKTKSIKTKPKKIKQNKYEIAEQNLIYYMLENPEVIEIYQKHSIYIPNEAYRKLAREIYYFYHKNGFIHLADIMTNLMDNQILKEALNELLNLDLKETYTKEEIMDYINTIQELNYKNEEKYLKEEIKKEIDPIKKAKLAEKIVEIKKRS